MRLLCCFVVVSCLAFGAGAQEVFSDGFEWGSICAWSNLWYPDYDEDGCGDELAQGQTVICPAPFGLAGNNLDCDDNDPNNFPDNIEICDGQDNDCDPLTYAPGGEDDHDGDMSLSCEDCNDNDPDNFPGNPEVCDGQDNNCNSIIDQAEVPVNVLCPTVPNAYQDCAGAVGCLILSCNPADTYFDVNCLYADGCECFANPLANQYNSCAQANDLGTLSDVDGDQVTVSGNTPFAGRVIWYRFFALDDPDVGEDEFLVDVFFATNPGSNYRMDVYRDACPGSGGTLMAYSVDSRYSSQPGSPSSNDSAWWIVKIYHVDAAAFCDSYSLELSNGLYE